MIKVFGKSDKVFLSNGDVVIKPLKARVANSDNGDFYLDLETGLEYVDFLTEGRIVIAPTPQGEQAFRIHNPTKTKSKITAKCYHVFYDTEDMLIVSCSFTNKTCAEALALLNASTEPVSSFTVDSNIISTNSVSVVRQSYYNAIQAILTAYGGHLVRDNFSIQIKSSIGSDKGVTVRYKKNLKEITCQENWDSVVTKLLPVGRDGVLLNAVDPTASIYVVSTVDHGYDYVKSVQFNQDINREDYTSETAYKQALVNDLYTQATAYLAQNSVPQISYTLKANLEEVTDIGDTVEVIDERLNVDLLTHVTGYVYDCLLKKYTEVTFGNFTQTLGNLISNITGAVSQGVTTQTQAIEDNVTEVRETTDTIVGILSNSYVVYDGSNIYVLDSLPYLSAVNVLRINKDGISHSSTGILGDYTTVWGIDNKIDVLSSDFKVDTKSLVDLIYPVGSLYMTTGSTSPASLFGGTWSVVSNTPSWAGTVYERTA